MREHIFNLKAGQLQRLSTGWVDRASAVAFEAEGLPALRFDNLGYSSYIWSGFWSGEAE
jgi:hypothetical protein